LLLTENCQFAMEPPHPALTGHLPLKGKARAIRSLPFPKGRWIAAGKPEGSGLVHRTPQSPSVTAPLGKGEPLGFAARSQTRIRARSCHDNVCLVFFPDENLYLPGSLRGRAAIILRLIKLCFSPSSILIPFREILLSETFLPVLTRPARSHIMCLAEPSAISIAHICSKCETIF